MKQLRSLFNKIMFILLALTSLSVLADSSQMADSKSIDHGRYLTKIAGCNDCHTPGYAQTGGKVPEQQWLVGDRLGWRGPWGTTYPANLRLFMQALSEEQWLKTAHTAQYRPPMPWFALRDMSEQDLRDLYRFIRYLGAAGVAVPAYLPPDQQPQGPFVLFPSPPPAKT
jgi:mono/diheme cytochrome c family protein